MRRNQRPSLDKIISKLEDEINDLKPDTCPDMRFTKSPSEILGQDVKDVLKSVVQDLEKENEDWDVDTGALEILVVSYKSKLNTLNSNQQKLLSMAIEEIEELIHFYDMEVDAG